MRFGRRVYAHSDLWLEAVTSYRQQKFQPKLTIGDRVSFSKGVHISCLHDVILGDDVLFGSNVYVSDGSHGGYSGTAQSDPSEAPAHRDLVITGPVHIEENVWLGDNVVILGPATIGKGSVIGANSVVRGEIPPNTIAAGAPARPLKRYEAASRTWPKL